MSVMLRLAICFVQILLFTMAMENRDDTIELFVSISLPFSVKRDEIINVPVLIRNPLHYKLHVVVTLNNSNAEYEFMDIDNKVISEKKLTKSIGLEDHSNGTIYFLIRPKVIGNVKLTFKASTSVDLEIIHKTLNVVPEGITEYDTHLKREDKIELFVSISLPFSVKRDEVINVPVLIRNPLHYKLHVVVTLNNSNAEYEFMDIDNKVISEKKLTKSIGLEDHSNGTIYFLIRPKVIGNVKLTFKASTSVDLEIIHKTLNVVPEGITEYDTHLFYVNLNKEPEQSVVELELPKDLVVPDSQHVEVGAVGDIMGLILKNLDNLVRIPKGPGEQTMSSLLPNFLIMKYLKSSKLLTPIVEARLHNNLEIGYQNMISCRHMDGSFSSFGPSRANEDPRNGSTWLTSFVLRFFPQFKEFINVDETIIKEGLTFLSKQQDQNGTFIENGEYLYPSQSNHITLTGAAVMAFLANSAYGNQYLQNIAKGLEFIAKNHEEYNYKLLHTQSLATYTYKQAKYVVSDQQSLIKWLSKTSLDNQSKWWEYVFLSVVEITSFNLLTLLNLNSTKIDSIVPTIKDIIAQRKRLGGSASTQYTVVGLISLIKFIEFDDYEPAKMDVNIIAKDKNATIKLTEENRILYTSVEMPPITKSLKIAAKGNGSALLQVAFQYNTMEDHDDLYPDFNISVVLYDYNTPTYLLMLVCVKYVGEEESSNMALLEIYTPSGYVITDENLKTIQKLKKVVNIELKNSGTLLVVYFDKLHKNFATCVMVEALRNHAVAMHKTAPILIYDYYNEDKRAVAFYDVDSKLCDICSTLEECSKCK